MDWKNIISQLVEKGYTQEQIAQKCGSGQTTISDLSCGKTQNPGFGLGQKLVDLLNSPFEAEA